MYRDLPSLDCGETRKGYGVIGLIQRVTHASVSIGDETVARTGHGLLALVGVEKEDNEAKADRLLQKILAYRVFADDRGYMNLCLNDTGGGLLLVPQFTLVADTKKGNRPGFSSGASPELGSQLFSYLVARAKATHADVGSGIFAADMKVALVNDGPATFWLQI